MTNLLEILLVGLVLSADSFSAALALGVRPHRLSDTLKFASTSGGAEALVSFIGAVAGAQVITHFESLGHWVSFSLLSAVALHMVYEGWHELRAPEQTSAHRNFHSYLRVLIVSFATSLDAFAVGVSLGVAGKPLIPFIASIGLWAFVSTIVAMSIAKKVSRKFGPLFSLVGSLILFTMAFKFLFEGL